MPAVKEVTLGRYLNRELSWIRFNMRVLAEAEKKGNPILERARFLSIFESNLDEFFMVRVSGLIEQFEGGVHETSPDGLTPSEQLKSIAAAVGPLRRKASEVFHKQLEPELRKHGIEILRYGELTPKQKSNMDSYFQREVFPLCTPLLLHSPPGVPFISNRSLNLAVELSDNLDVRLARIKVPTVVPRLVRLSKRSNNFVLLEELIANNLGDFFPGVKIIGAHLFRVLRDADVEIRQLEASDLITSIEESVRLRRFGDPVALQHDASMPAAVLSQLMSFLNLDEQDVFEVNGILGLEFLDELAAIDKPNLRFPPHLPYVAENLSSHAALFETISGSDILLHHPFDGFRPVEEFVAAAAADPQVIGIKQTLYRVGSESPIIESLAEAADDGKQVAAVVELKARFDESNNIVWAKALERVGAHVTFGFAELKIHCKLCLIVRREPGGLKAYAHIGTGNYNPKTAREYTDLGLFTCDASIVQDVGELFNLLTGFSRQSEFRNLLVAPLNLREGILDRIRRESDHARKGKPARIVLKLNSLVDPEVIDELYLASQAGVVVQLIVRGICCLRPGVEGLSERIQVVSIIGRFLEHSRVYYFENGGSPDVLIGSADAMRRNLDRRVEVLVTVKSPPLISHLRTNVLEPYLSDNMCSWVLRPDGTYGRKEKKKHEKTFDSQEWLAENPSSKTLYGRAPVS